MGGRSAITLSTRSVQHWAQRGSGPNLMQQCDTNDIDTAISSVTYLEQAALPAFTYGAHLSPAQASLLLQRLPRVLKYQHGRRAPATEQAQLLAALLDAAGSRLADVVQRCRADDLANAMWAFGALRMDHPKLFAQAEGRIRALLPTPSLRVKDPPAASAGAASPLRGAAASGAQPPAAKWVVPSAATAPPPALPVSLSTSPPAVRFSVTTPHVATMAWAWAARRPAAPSDGGSDLALQALFNAAARRPATDLDQRSVCKLAWAMARTKTAHAPLLAKLAAAATAQMQQQQSLHDPLVSASLQPRRTYKYSTVRGWVTQDAPKPARPSKYLRNQAPFITVRDYEYGTLASLLHACAKLGFRDPHLAKAAAAHVMASAGTRAGAAEAADGAAAAPLAGSEARSASLAQLRSVMRMVLGLYAQGVRQPGLAEAALADAPLHLLQPRALVSLTVAATHLGARDPLLMRRLGRALYAATGGLQKLSKKQLASVKAAFARADYHDGPVQERLDSLTAPPAPRSLDA